MLAVITLRVDPTIQAGPFELAWHGAMIAFGVIAGGWLAGRYATERGLDRERLVTLILVVFVAAIIGAKLLYLLQHDPAGVVEFDRLTSSRGYSIYGGLVGGGLGAALWVYGRGLSARYLDALAAGLPLGMAVGRIGDVLNGEHYGPVSDLPWAIVYTHPEAEVPSPDLAYHPGGLYEVVLSLAILALLWPLRHRFVRPGMLVLSTLGAYAAGRLVMFNWRDDVSAGLAGLNSAQLESLVLLLACLAGAIWLRRRPAPPPPATQL